VSAAWAQQIDLSNLNGLWSGMNAGVTYQYNVTTGILAVQTIPEPSTYALLGLGAVALVAHILRRRRSA
jgi:PEP-CTERM putative exosortase interaction domain/Deltaproteobacterial GC-motif protein sorting domain